MNAVYLGGLDVSDHEADCMIAAVAEWVRNRASECSVDEPAATPWYQRFANELER
jgi:hypothetical protein